MNEKPTERPSRSTKIGRVVAVSGPESTIRKVLALANDPAAFEGERAVARQKATELERKSKSSAPRVTEKNIDSLPAPQTGSVIYRDTPIRGLGLRVTAQNARSWTLDYSCAGRQRRYTLAARHVLTLKAAVNEAKRLQGLVAQGVDPFDMKSEREAAATAKREAERRAKDPDADPSVQHLADRWFKEYAERALRPNTLISARASLDKVNALGLGDKKVREVTRRDVVTIMHALRKTPVAANRCRSFLSTIFNFGIANGIGLSDASVNPARRIKGILVDNAEAPRKVIVPTQKQIDALHAALDARAGQPSADAIRLMLLSGARKNEILRMEWSEIDDLFGAHPVWLLPAARAKQKKDRAFPLADPKVLDLLRQLHAKNGKSRFVLSARRAGTPLKDVNGLWRAVRDEAGLTRFRLHDLRHVFVSRGLNAGVPIYTVGQLVGHSSAYMTSRYGHGDNKVAADAARLIGAGLAPTTANTNGAHPVHN